MLNIGEIIQTVKSMIETKIEMVKLDIQEEFSGIVSRFFILILIGAMAFLVLLFLSLSMAFYLNQIMNSSFFGFLIVGSIFMIVVLTLIISKNSRGLQRRIQASIKTFIFSVSRKNQSSDE